MTDDLNNADREYTHVLLVDDDRQWADIMATDIEEEAPECEVTVAASAEQALKTLTAADDIDCLVTDYRMPGTDGLTLMTEVRETRPRLPVLLVTSHGSEDVAARAIDAGVDDYIIKEFGTEQAKRFVSKIRTAVDQYRLRQALEESEQRYRTVTEQSRDAIAMFQDGRLLFCNRRLVELTGRDRDSLEAADIVADVVHSDDREQVRTVLDGWADGSDQPPLHEARIVQPDGTVRHCEYTGRQVEYNGETATLVSIRDVTERQRRERELQWERELNRRVQEALVESQTRESLERKVTEQLQRHGYALAWVGEQVDNVLVPRVVGGDRRYVEAIDRTVEGGAAASEPSIRAARTGDPQFVGDFAEFAATDWRDTASDYRYRSGAAIPLVYNAIPYGVIAVYRSEAGRFDETERRLLTELANTVAFAIHSLETQGALAANQTVDVTVQVDDGYYLVDLAADGTFADCDRVQVRGTVPVDDDTVLQYLEVTGGDIWTLRDVISEHPDVEAVTVVSEDDATWLRITIRRSVPEAALASRGTVVRSTTVGATGAAIDIELPAKADVRAAVNHLEGEFGTVSVQTVTEGDHEHDVSQRQTLGTAALTEKQLTALKAAYYDGFFEQPRQSSASDVAESLGVSHSTFLRHLRAAQQKIFGAQFE